MLLRGFVKVPVGVVAFVAASSFVSSQSCKSKPVLSLELISVEQ